VQLVNENGARCKANGTPLLLPRPEQPLPTPATLAIRPEWLRVLGPGDNAEGCNVLEARIVDAVFLGSHVSLKADIGGGAMITIDGAPHTGLPRPGDSVRIAWRRDQAIVMPEA
jgi:ABC-type Fe3+/spermidine/putrescine transport system ATPase subunit